MIIHHSPPPRRPLRGPASARAWPRFAERRRCWLLAGAAWHAQQEPPEDTPPPRSRTTSRKEHELDLAGICSEKHLRYAKQPHAEVSDEALFGEILRRVRAVQVDRRDVLLTTVHEECLLYTRAHAIAGDTAWSFIYADGIGRAAMLSACVPLAFGEQLRVAAVLNVRTGEVGHAQGRGFSHHWALNRCIEHVSQALHGPIAGRHAAVNTQDRIAGIAPVCLHRGQQVVGLEAYRFQRRAGEFAWT